MKKIVEICCGSYYDAKQAALGGAERIELNSGLQLGGLTPTLATLQLVKQDFPGLKVIAMVRPRGAGFCYLAEDFQVMEEECESLILHGADGIAFGCLNQDASLNQSQNRAMIGIIKNYQKEAVFHRAFDCTLNPFQAMEELIFMGVDRVLTSGQKPTAPEGAGLLRKLQDTYGQAIQILAGSGVNGFNANQLMEDTGIHQVHSSCKDWIKDATTITGSVSYSMVPGEYASCYDVVSEVLVRELLRSVGA